MEKYRQADYSSVTQKEASYNFDSLQNNNDKPLRSAAITYSTGRVLMMPARKPQTLNLQSDGANSLSGNGGSGQNNGVQNSSGAMTTTKQARILLVEDEVALCTLLAYNLEAEGYHVVRAERGDDAELSLLESPPDLVVLDWMLPGISGLEICRRLRMREATRTLPVIMLTARGEESERVRGLSVGADDYVVKPFSVPELMARVRALLRRARPERIAAKLVLGDIELDRETHRVRRINRDVHLGPTEFRLLDYLMEKPGRVFSRSQLLDHVWGISVEIDERTVDVHIGRLRKALSKGRERDPIRTVRGAGYAFDETFGKN